MNWEERLKRPVTRDDVDLSKAWPTCAVGELFPEQAVNDGGPEDALLYEIGTDFHAYLHDAYHTKTLSDEPILRAKAAALYQRLKKMRPRGGGVSE